MKNWPDDADGDVLRRMEKSGFDFTRPCLIDFNVDFESWPPSNDALSILRKNFPSTTVYDPSEESDGYVQFQVFEKLSYDLVTNIQSEVSCWMAPFSGICESWGVLH